MQVRVARILKGLGLGAVFCALSASATNYTLWIKGRGAAGTPGHHADFSYWGPASAGAGINPRAVNWDGYSRIAAENGRVRDALDCYCTGPNWCYVAAYSAGDPMIGYALALYGGSARYKKLPVPNAAGQCTNSDGTTQVGWNIYWVGVAAGAAGGTELSDYGAWTTSEPLVADLRTTTARAMYDHNATRGITFYMYAGARGTAYSWLLPGQDDEVIAYHSSGAISGASGGSYCNPRDWSCNDLTLGFDPAQGGRPKWAHHYVMFRDDGEDYKHYVSGNWQGIAGRLRIDVQTHAR
jgi:hypothetical protein